MAHLENKSLLDDIAAILLIVSSGSTVFYVGNQTTTMVLYAIFGCFYALRKSRSVRNNTVRDNKILFLYLGLWPIINAVLLHNGVGFAATKPFFFGIGSLLIISYANFLVFRNCLLKWMQILLIVSIFVHIGYYYFGIPAEVVELGGSPRNICLHFFDVGFGENERLFSIFWEPGQCQIVIFFILCLFADDIQDLKKLKYNLLRFSPFIVAIILTQSTTAFMTVIVLFATIILKSNIVKKNLILLPLAICAVAFVAVQIFHAESVQNKLGNYGEEGRSATVRVMDNIAMLNMIVESPLIGHGMDTPEYKSLSNRLYNHAASNGWLNTCAEEGLPYLLVIIIAIFKGIKRQGKNIPAYWILAVLLVSQAGEYALFLPITFLYIFKFASYNEKCISQ